MSEKEKKIMETLARAEGGQSVSVCKFCGREIDWIYVRVLEIYTSTYACPACEEKTGYAHIYEHKAPPSLMKHCQRQ